MCGLLLLLLAGAADCARPHYLTRGQAYSVEYQASPDYELQSLLPFQPSGDPFDRSVRTNRPSYESDSFSKRPEVRDKHVPKLRTNVHSTQGIEQTARGVHTDKNNRHATHASLQEPVKKRKHETTARHSGPNETPLVNKFNPSGNDEEEESTWVWGTSDGVDPKNTTVVDDLDDRTSIAGANCPTGQVKVDGKCVDKH